MKSRSYIHTEESVIKIRKTPLSSTSKLQPMLKFFFRHKWNNINCRFNVTIIQCLKDMNKNNEVIHQMMELRLRNSHFLSRITYVYNTKYTLIKR